VGNNVQLGRIMGWQVSASFGEQNLVLEASLSQAQTLAEVSWQIEAKLETRTLANSAGEHPVRRIAWCTGAAQGFIEAAAERGVDAFVSGEVSEPTFHLARELGVHYIAAGHHATERYGVQALCKVIADRFDIEQQFIDIPNPV
jgi:putative NIF3 family GTP cyclohydrolase 1 type 2